MISTLQQKRQFNTAGLEADVMRFMAIMAFCLIAMTAIVKDEQDHKAETGNINLTAPTKILPTDLGNDASIEIEIVASNPHKSIDLPVIKSIPKQEQPISIQKKVEEPTIEPDPLTLRFESDEAFVSLIASGKLQLFAKMESGFFTMDQNFSVSSFNPAGDLYEVMAKSIPTKITRVFEQSGPVSLYLVMLPEEASEELRHFFETEDTPTTGALIIRQSGKIIHEN